MFRSTLIVSLFAAFGAAISFLNQLVLARYFGTSSEMDAYLTAISLPMTVSGLLSGVLNYQLVPALQRAESHNDGANALIRSLVFGVGSGAAIVALAGIWAADRLVFMLNPGFSTPIHAATVELVHITWISLPLSILGSIYIAGLHVRQRFAAATLLPSTPIVGSMIVCLLAHALIGISAVIWGQLIGYVVMLVGLRVAYGASKAGSDWVGLRAIIFEFPSALAAVLIFVLYPFSDAFWGSRIGSSTVSYLGYAQRLLVGFSGLAVVGLTTVLFPRLARHAAEGKDDVLRKDLGSIIRVMLVCMIPSATVFGFLATPSVQILFQRGSFRLEDAAALGALLPVMLFGMVAMSCAGLVFKALFARKEARVACALSLSGALVYFALSGILGNWIGLKGIGIAYAISWWFVLVFGLGYLWRDIPIGVFLHSDFKFISQLGFAATIVAVVCWLGTQWLPPEASSNSLLRFFVVAVVWGSSFATYLIVGGYFPALLEIHLINRKIIELVGPKRLLPK